MAAVLRAFIPTSAKVCFLKNFFLYQAGWQDRYTGYDDDGQPPSHCSYSIYFGADLVDVTIRDTISMRASSYGLAARSGGFVKDVLPLDNNASFRTVGGNYEGADPAGQYMLLTDTVTTSGAHKEADKMGALSYGIDEQAELTSLVDNTVAHMADPANPG